MPDRRTRKRDARRERLLVLADEIVERDGVHALTMAALAEAGDYAPASLYTYFGSRSALLAALQVRALDVLRGVAEASAERWDAALAEPAGEPDGRHTAVAALARLHAFSDLFLAAPRTHPREFSLQQELLVAAGAEDAGDASSVVPAAMAVLDLPRRLLAEAVDVGALQPQPTGVDPLGNTVDGAFARTLAWVAALNGALLVNRLAVGLPTTGEVLGAELTASLLAGWGADPDQVSEARRFADSLRATGATDSVTDTATNVVSTDRKGR